MDCNRFYSTLAQSSAALVGVLSACTFARLATRRASANSTRTQLCDYLAMSTRYRAIAEGSSFEQTGRARLQYALRRLASTKRNEFDNPGLTDGYSLYYENAELFTCFLPIREFTNGVEGMLRYFQEHSRDGGQPQGGVGGCG